MESFVSLKFINPILPPFLYNDFVNAQFETALSLL